MRIRLRGYLLLAGAAILAGCAAEPVSTDARSAPRPAPRPVATKVESGPPAAEPDSLGAVLLEVERDGSAFQIALAEAQARGEAVTATKALYWGEATPFVRDVHYDSSRLVNPLSPPINIATIPFDQNQIGVGLVLRLPIDISGDIRARVQSATARHNAAVSDAANARLRLFLAAASLYRGIQATVGVRAALQRQADALRSHLRVAEEAVRVERMARVEALRIRSDLDLVEGELAALAGREAGLRARLAALLRRRSYEAAIAIEKVSPGAPTAASDKDVDRPDLVVARQNMLAAEAETRVRKAASWPRLSLDAAVGYNRGYTEDGDTTAQAGFLLEWTLFDAGRRRARTREARHRAYAARLRLEQLHDTATAEVRAALAAWTAAQRKHAAARSSATSAQETARIQGRRFTEGRLSAADLVDAEAAQARAEADVAVSLVQWWLADDTLRVALGRPPRAYPEEDQ